MRTTKGLHAKQHDLATVRPRQVQSVARSERVLEKYQKICESNHLTILNIMLRRRLALNRNSFTSTIGSAIDHLLLSRTIAAVIIGNG